MRQAKWSWRNLLVLIGALVGGGVTASLGRWQLDRAAQKEALAQMRAERSALPAIDASALQGLDEQALQALLHRPIVLRGRWLAEQTVWLENRQMGGRTGFHVLTPLQLQGSAQVLLVQRGWAPRNFIDRQALPPIETPEGEVTVSGRLNKADERTSFTAQKIVQIDDLHQKTPEIIVTLPTGFTEANLATLKEIATEYPGVSPLKISISSGRVFDTGAGFMVDVDKVIGPLRVNFGANAVKIV